MKLCTIIKFVMMELNRLIEEFRDSLKQQVIAASSLMIIIPFSTFFYIQSYLTDLWIISGLPESQIEQYSSDVDLWSAAAAVVAVQLVIILIVLVKYCDDILHVFVRDQGHLEYNPDGSLRPQGEDEDSDEGNDEGS